VFDLQQAKYENFYKKFVKTKKKAQKIT